MNTALTSIDNQLRIEAKVWRWQRTDGDTRANKRKTLDRIDRLLDKRNEASAEAAPVPTLCIRQERA